MSIFKQALQVPLKGAMEIKAVMLPKTNKFSILSNTGKSRAESNKGAKNREFLRNPGRCDIHSENGRTFRPDL
jgi:hypothetical protein